jgi:hypothetical protein
VVRWLKFGLALVLVLVTSVALLVFFVPEHWLRAVNFATVTVDGRPIQSSIYIGHTTTNEADAFLLVRIPGEGSFLFNFLGETYREASEYEFVRLYRSAVILKPMSKGPWFEPLPSVNLNEFRIHSSRGHTIVVSF